MRIYLLMINPNNCLAFIAGKYYRSCFGTTALQDLLILKQYDLVEVLIFHIVLQVDTGKCFRSSKNVR